MLCNLYFLGEMLRSERISLCLAFHTNKTISQSKHRSAIIEYVSANCVQWSLSQHNLVL